MNSKRYREVFRRVKPATVAIVAENKPGASKPFTIIGSGFCLDPEGLVITCRHVLEAFMAKTAAEQIADVPEEERQKKVQRLGPVDVITPYVAFYDSARAKGKVFVLLSRVDKVMAKTDYDVALIRIYPDKAFRNGYPCLEIEDYENVSEGDEIATCGFPLASFMQDQLGTVTSSFTKGIISSILPGPGVSKQYLAGFQLDLTATYGSSGGPVFSLDTGNVFGVVERGVFNSSGEMLQGIVKAAPVYPALEHESVERIKASKLGEPPDPSLM